MYIGLGAKGWLVKKLRNLLEKFKTLLCHHTWAGCSRRQIPQHTWVLSAVSGPKAAQEVQSATDLVVWVGNNSPFSVLWFPKDAKVIQIDVDSAKFGKRHSTDVSMLADAKKALRAIIDAGEERSESPLYKAAICRP